MTIAPSQSSAPPTLGSALKSATGYFTVAVACAWAGYALRHQRILVTENDLPLIALAVAGLLPAYINRGILYELNRPHHFDEDDAHQRWLKILSVQLPLIIGGCILAVVIVSRGSFLHNSIKYSPWQIGRHVLITIAPIYIINFRLTKLWLKDDRLFTFRFRTFFPAFATCLMPFTFGYSDFGDFLCSGIAAILIVGYWLIALYANAHKTAFIGVGLLIAIVVWQIIAINPTTPHIECAQALFFGTIMTLLMGVSESWRVTTRLLNDRDLRAYTYSEREKKFYLSGTNIATALFLPLFLLTFLHPSTSPLYLWLFFFLLGGQYVVWFVARTRMKSALWSTVGVGSGLLVPFTIGVCAHLAGKYSSLKSRFLLGELGPPVEVIAANAALAWYLMDGCVRHIMKIKRQSPAEGRLAFFLTPFPCICITGVLSSIFSILLTGYKFGAAMIGSFIDSTESRLPTLIDIYIGIAGICAIAISINYFKNKMARRQQSAEPSINEPQIDDRITSRFASFVAKRMAAFSGMTRPLPALIAGLLTMLVAERSGAVFATRAGLAMTCIVMFGFATDNIGDFADDQVAGVGTPLTLRMISLPEARFMAICLALAACVFSPQLKATVAIVAPAMFALLLYPSFSRSFPKLKGVYTSCLVSLPLLYPSFMLDLKVPIQYYLLLCGFMFAREVFIDCNQVSADAKTHRETLAVSWNKEIINRLAEYVMVATTALLIVATEGHIAKTLGTICFLTVLVILYSPLLKSNRAGWLRISMLVGAVSLALSLS